MKLIIDIPEEIYKASKIIDVKYEDVVQIPLEVIANGTPIPDNATNGEVIMAMFLTVDTYFSNVIDMKLWWNAPYRKRDKK